MADEQKCACGHTLEEHWGEERCTQDCQCREYRPALPWPTDPGWWYCSNPHAHVLADGDGNSENLVVQYDYGAYGRDEWNQYYGPSLFTKCDPNPFARQGERSE